ncbi:hypothetical protein FCG40_07930 [Fimbriimonadia bacterium ATM]|nr:hypothetical protein [Fimbriimonadia bacterium ATM]
MSRSKERGPIYLEPIEGSIGSFRLMWSGRELTRGFMYERGEKHTLVDLMRPWSEQGITPRDVKIRLSVAGAEGYEIRIFKRGRAEPVRGEWVSGYKFEVFDKVSGDGAIFALWRGTDTPDLPVDSLHTHLRTGPDESELFELSNGRYSFPRHAILAPNSAASAELSAQEEAEFLRVVASELLRTSSVPSRELSKTLGEVAARNVGYWLLWLELDSGALRESTEFPSAHDSFERARRMVVADVRRTSLYKPEDELFRDSRATGESALIHTKAKSESDNIAKEDYTERSVQEVLEDARICLPVHHLLWSIPVDLARRHAFECELNYELSPVDDLVIAVAAHWVDVSSHVERVPTVDSHQGEKSKSLHVYRALEQMASIPQDRFVTVLADTLRQRAPRAFEVCSEVCEVLESDLEEYVWHGSSERIEGAIGDFRARIDAEFEEEFDRYASSYDPDTDSSVPGSGFTSGDYMRVQEDHLDLEEEAEFLTSAPDVGALYRYVTAVKRAGLANPESGRMPWLTEFSGEFCRLHFAVESLEGDPTASV